MNEQVRELLREYLELCESMASGQLSDTEYMRVSADRTWTHNELIRLLGPAYDRPFDMQAYACQHALP